MRVLLERKRQAIYDLRIAKIANARKIAREVMPIAV